jgi:hypothetical protein
VIQLVGDPETESGAGALTVELRSGRRVQTTIDHATGTIYRPMDDAALRRKLFDAVQGVLQRDRVGQLASAREGGRALDDVAGIMELAVYLMSLGNSFTA